MKEVIMRVIAESVDRPSLVLEQRVSLVNGSTAAEGTVLLADEYFICDDAWDLPAAEVPVVIHPLTPTH